MSCQSFSATDEWEGSPDVPGSYLDDPDFSATRAGFTIGPPHRDSSSPTPDDNPYDGPKIRLGVCAMAKKVKSKPMKEILKRLSYFSFLEFVIFEEELILNADVEDWPIVDCLISFHSAGFPLDKAVMYDKLRRPFVINHLKMQYTLMDRGEVHNILAQRGIEQPKYAIVNRSGNSENDDELIEYEDHIEVNGVVFNKPFVEKPLSAEDHNVYIYFPSSAGGGSQRLFRKIGSRSSVYSPVSRVRTTGSYIYEEFMPTDGTDVKVYTVGSDYAHAEARKAPALDGKVERDQNGKEVRYPIILTAKEKMIARGVSMAFQQNVCGFDLLRANGVSYVCDVNGFSFVKTSSKYYDDCATVLGSMILRELAPQLSMHVPPELASLEVLPVVPTTYGTMMELRCVIAVIRHGDRTPKQKMKMEVKHQRFFDLFEKYGGYKTMQLKLKHPTQLQEVLDIARFLLEELESNAGPPEFEEKKTKLIQLKFVLEMYGHFSGINRKIQLKYQPKGFSGTSSTEDAEREPSLVLILKWGGELTPAGKTQAEELGKAFRCMYPTYGETPGLGLLRLHSTYRHDLKIYASDEGRVQMTAAAFAKGFLALEGELTPILVQMVKSGTHTNGLLDNADEAQPLQQQAKQTLQEVLNTNEAFSDENYEKVNPGRCIAIERTRAVIANPFTTLEEIHDSLLKMLKKLKTLKADPQVYKKVLYHTESLELMFRRWWKLEKDFRHKSGQYDVSKIPDIYDNIKYDLQHNCSILDLEVAERLYVLSKSLADIVIPQEYGLTNDEKVKIGAHIAAPLLRKIKADLLTNAHESEEYTRLDSRYIPKEEWFSMGVASPDRHVRTRLYFTSESHIHSLLSLINHGGLADEEDSQWTRARQFLSGVSELNYISQIVIMMYEDPTKEKNSEERFHIEIHFSPGAYGVNVATHNHERTASGGWGYRPNKGRSQASTVSTNTPPSETSAKGLGVETVDSTKLPTYTEIQPDNKECDKQPYHQDSFDHVTPPMIDEMDELDSRDIISSAPIPVNQHSSSETNTKRHNSIPGFMHHVSPTATGSALISTKVISGSRSAPNLHDINENKALEAYGLAVPEIMPLETLHNSLTLAHFDKFLTNIIDMVAATAKRSYGAMPRAMLGSLDTNMQQQRKQPQGVLSHSTRLIESVARNQSSISSGYRAYDAGLYQGSSNNTKSPTKQSEQLLNQSSTEFKPSDTQGQTI